MTDKNIDYHLAIITIYPELKDNTKAFWDNTITLQNDGDGKGTYIKEWNYNKPKPKVEEIAAAYASAIAAKS